MSTIPADALASAESTRAAVLAPARSRVQSIDVVRGLVIVLMALDHVRDYFTDVRFSPVDLAYTDPALFFTRWITHLCAPTFIFLAGVSAWLTAQRSSLPVARRHLVTRGAWIILLEFTVVQFGWSFNFDYEMGLIMQVMWAIGASMIVLAALIHLPRAVLAVISLAMIFGHNLLDGIEPASFGAWAWMWTLLHVQGPTPVSIVMYPLIPWIGVMALGYCAGAVFELPAPRRRALFALAGATCLALFVALRALNGYGDPQPWSVQSTPVFTLLSFLNVDKYPPSLMYLLVMLGIALLLLALFETVQQGRLVRTLRMFGSVPLFFYVLHIPLAHLTAGLLALAMGFGTQLLTSLFTHLPAGWGFGLPGVYAAWIVVLALLYPACRWFADLKRRRRDWWLSYL